MTIIIVGTIGNSYSLNTPEKGMVSIRYLIRIAKQCYVLPFFSSVGTGILSL